MGKEVLTIGGDFVEFTKKEKVGNVSPNFLEHVHP